jgi:hypothetical protein
MSTSYREHIRNVLVFTEKRKMEQNCERAGVGSQDDQLRNTTVESLGSLVGSLLKLAIMGSLLDEVKDLLRESLVGLADVSIRLSIV